MSKALSGKLSCAWTGLVVITYIWISDIIFALLKYLMTGWQAVKQSNQVLYSVLQIRRGNLGIIFRIFFLKTCGDPSLEPSRRDGSNEGHNTWFC